MLKVPGTRTEQQVPRSGETYYDSTPDIASAIFINKRTTRGMRTRSTQRGFWNARMIYEVKLLVCIILMSMNCKELQ